MALIVENFTFDRGTYNAPTGASSLAIHRYKNTADTTADIKASGYFNNLLVPAVTGNQQQPLVLNDILAVEGSDGTDFVRFTSVTSPVTVAPFINAGDLPDGSITLPKLATGVSPSHVVKFGAQHATVGGAAAEVITVTGALATDIAHVTLKVSGVAPQTVLTSAVTANTLTVTFSADPSTDHVLYYTILRAAV